MEGNMSNNILKEICKKVGMTDEENTTNKSSTNNNCSNDVNYDDTDATLDEITSKEDDEKFGSR